MKIRQQFSQFLSLIPHFRATVAVPNQDILAIENITDNANHDEVHQEKDKIQQEVDCLLQLQEHDIFFDLVKNGYQPSAQQLQLLSEQFNKHMTGALLEASPDSMEKLHLFYENNYQMTKDNCLHFFNTGLMDKYFSYFIDDTYSLDEESPLVAFVLQSTKKLFNQHKDTFCELFDAEIKVVNKENNYCQDYYKAKGGNFHKNVIMLYQVWRPSLLQHYDMVGIKTLIECIQKQHQPDSSLKDSEIIKEKAQFFRKENPEIYEKLQAFSDGKYRGSWSEHLEHIKSRKADIEKLEKQYTPSEAYAEEFKQELGKIEQKYQSLAQAKRDFCQQLLNDFKDYRQYGQEIVARVKNAYTLESMVQHAIEVQHTKVESLQLSQLPAQSQQTLKDIQRLGTQLRGLGVNVEGQLFLDNLFQEVLPQTVGKYLAMDAEYRETFKNDKKQSITDLFIQSLKNIQEAVQHRLDQAVQTKNEDALRDMQVNQVYTKSLCQP